jgi:outer membrane receptor protein involved in Fe transport
LHVRPSRRAALPIAALFFLLFALVLTTARRARAEDAAEEADLHFNIGADKYEAGDFKGALEHFLASNRLVANRNVVFNIARTYEQLKRAPDAYRYYVVALDGETNPAAKKRIEDAIARITPLVAIIKIESTPPGATIYLDRKDLGPRGVTPRTLGLPAGKHKVILELAGHESAETGAPVDLTIGQERRVALQLVPILGKLVVDGAPGAEVRIDTERGEPACVEPCTIAITPGKHTAWIAKTGFVSNEYTIDVPPKETVPLHTNLMPQTGAIVVSADVREALITVDGTPMGFTPAVLTVPVGPHVVKISQTGFRTFEQRVEVKVREQTRIEVELTLFEEVTAASRVSESVEDAPASVSIISYQELRAMGYPTVAEAVRGVRGMYLSDDRSYVTIGVRGFSRPGDYGNRVLVLLDGQPMNDNYIWSSYVGFDGRVDIDDIERIEVVRGPGSVLYGTSAFFGVINLVTRSRDQPTHGEVGVSTAENSVFRARSTAVVRLSKDAGFWTSVSGAQSSGTDFFFPEYVADPRNPDAERGANGLPVDGNARGVDGFNAGMFTGRVWYKSLTLQWFLNSRKKTLPTGEYGSVFGDPGTHFADTRAMLEARFEPQVSKTTQLLSRAHANLYDFDGRTSYLAADGGSTQDTFRGRWGGFEQRVIYTPSSLLRATVGGEVIRHFQTLQLGDSPSGPYVFDDRGNPGRDDPFTVAAGYVLADVAPSPRFKISGGARLDYYSSLDRFNLGAAVNPRMAFVIKPYTSGNLKVLLGKAFRAPSVYELFYSSATQVKPFKLDPEQIYSGEIELTHSFSPLVLGSVAAYGNYVSDLVELRDLPDGRTQYANSTAPVLVLGAEAELRREWRAGWMLAATYSHTRVRYVDAPELRDVPNSLVHLASLKGAAPIIGRSLMAMTRVTLEGPRPDRNLRITDPPQGTTDIGIIWDLVFSGEAERLGVRYAIGAYNLANWKYDTVPSGEFRQRTIVQSGRTVLASLSASF